MPAGRSIRIFLATGEVTGIRHAELVNWTGQAIVCPRVRLDELEEWSDDVERPGVYLLVGAEGPAEREVYFGEAENVLRRVRQHIGTKEFQEVVLFTSKDENLTKAHVKFLEHKLVQKAKQIGRYKVLNGNEPAETALPRADRAAMEEFLENIEVLLGALGHRVFVPVVSATAPPDAQRGRFRFAVKNAEAFGAPTDEGFVVYAGSTGLRRSNESMGVGNIALKNELLELGKLVEDGELVRFTDDVLFGTPSQAGSMISGTSCNGRISWKRVGDGRTLNDLEADASARIPATPDV